MMKNVFSLPNGKGIAIVLIFALLLSGCGKKTDNGDIKSTAAGDVVLGSTPEETVTIFLTALAEQDVNTMLSCCYIEDYCERFSFEQFVDRMGSMIPNISIAPSELPYYKELMELELYGDFAKKIKLLTYSLLCTDEQYAEFLSGMAITGVDASWVQEFTKTADPEQLKNMSIERIDANNPDMQNTEQIKEIFSRNYFCETAVERTALIDLNGNLFYKGFTLVEIDGKWQIAQLGAVLLGESAMGIATQVESAAEYLDLIA